MTPHHAPLLVVGTVESSLSGPEHAPLQPDEPFAPPAVLHIAPEFAAAVAGLHAGDEIIVITWLHVADRNILTVHPRGDEQRARVGVFATRSQDRPNPIGLHRTTITHVASTVIGVAALEAIDRTPILDIKPVLGQQSSR